MSSLNLNKVILCGRLTKDPELRQTQGGVPVLSFTLAINRRYSKSDAGQAQQADFISLVAWRQTAEFISRFFKKGSALCVTGSIQTRQWKDDQTQTTKYSTEVIVDEAMFVDSRNENGASQDTAYMPESYKSSAPSYSNSDNAGFEEVKSDDDLPF